MFGEWLRAEMAEKGITQAVLAKPAGLTQQAVSRWVRGLARPEGAGTMKAIAAALGVPIQEVVDRVEEAEVPAAQGAAARQEQERELREEFAELRERLAALEAEKKSPRRARGA